MGKSKKASSVNVLPLAPWIYVDDPTPSAVFASQLGQLIPKTAYISPEEALSPSSKALKALQNTKERDTVVIISGNKTDNKAHVKSSIREQAIKRGCNFASIRLRYEGTQAESAHTANHLDLQVTSWLSRSGTAEVKKTADKIYKWLFTVLSVKETLHLMSNESMKKDDHGTGYRDYEYCTIAECRSRPEDAKIQFVALILTKPVVGTDMRLTWQVADKTGVANFYFKYRDESSKYTWDWVLNLQPGQRRCLPRMPSVKVTESTVTTIAVAPFRFTGTMIEKTGHAISLVGRGVRKAGKKLKMGQRSKWVPEADVEKEGRDTSSSSACVEEHSEEKTWKDDDSVASTTAGSVLDEKKNF